MAFGHEQLDVYQLALDYCAWVMDYSFTLKSPGSSLRDQWLRACASIPLNTAEGNGKFSEADRRRFFETARASSLECAAIQDVLMVSKQMDPSLNTEKKVILERIVSTLTKLGGRGYAVHEESESYGSDTDTVDTDCDHEPDSDSTRGIEPA